MNSELALLIQCMPSYLASSQFSDSEDPVSGFLMTPHSSSVAHHASEKELCQKPSGCDSLGGCFLHLGWAKARQGYHFMGTFYPQALQAPSKGENVAGIVLRKSGDSERRWFLRNETQLRDWRFFFEKLAISVKTVININLLYQPNLDITFFLLTLKVQE